MARMKNISYSGNLIADVQITAQATRKAGVALERKEKINNARLASIPIMVGSELDTLYGYSKEAKKEHLEGIIQTLPWVATIDKFQHWVYENPNHSLEEREQNWVAIFQQFSNTITDWEALEAFRAISWQKQLHLFEVPFYYIEYAIAQLGAIAVWKNYKKDPKKGFADYLAALKLGYTKPIKEIYKTAGIKFDFSQAYIHELIAFVREEMEKVG